MLLAGGLLTASVSSGRAESRLDFHESNATVGVTIAAEPPIGQWSTSSEANTQFQAQSAGGYRLKLQRSESGSAPIWKLTLHRADEGSFAVTACSWEARISIGRVAAVFDTQVAEGPSVFRQAPQLDVAIETRPNRGIPFMMACDHYGRNSLAVGPIDQTGTYRVTGRRLGPEYLIQVRRTEYPGDDWFRGDRFADTFVVSTSAELWFDAARAYADAVDEFTSYRPRPIPPAALRPYYSTWYAFGQDLDEAVVWDNAVVAAEMGIGNFLVFIGWSECKDWFNSANAWGDYTPCTTRFRDMAGLVRRMHEELGLAVCLWTAPTWIGSGSQSFEKLKEFRSKWPEGDFDRNLDPRSPVARRHIRERFALMAQQLGVDGYYVDFLDTVYNRNDAPHEKDPALFGAALDQFLGACYEGFAGRHPEPLVEYRMPFANLLTKRHASVFTTTYTPHRWDRNRLLALTLRPFSRGVVTTCDPLVWSREEFEDRDFVGKTLSAAMMCGPPGISMDLTRMSSDRRRELKAWFDFYAAHRGDFANGEFRPFGSEYHYPEMMVSREHTAYAWVSRWETGRIPLPDGTRHAFIFTNLPRDESFIARLDLTSITGLVPGRYTARRFNSTLESHEPPMEITVRPPPARIAAPQPIKTPRENWDWTPDEKRPSLDIARGGFWELQRVGE